MTTHEFISRQIEEGLWEYCKVLFFQAQTLDKYYRVAELVNFLEPDREHGYKKRLCGYVKSVERYLKKDKILGVLVVRPARGTLCNELIPADKQPTGSPLYTPNYGTMSYYDLDAQGWRSFRLDCLHTIESYSTLNTIDLSDD